MQNSIDLVDATVTKIDQRINKTIKLRKEIIGRTNSFKEFKCIKSDLISNLVEYENDFRQLSTIIKSISNQNTVQKQNSELLMTQSERFEKENKKLEEENLINANKIQELQNKINNLTVIKCESDSFNNDLIMKINYLEKIIKDYQKNYGLNTSRNFINYNDASNLNSNRNELNLKNKYLKENYHNNKTNVNHNEFQFSGKSFLNNENNEDNNKKELSYLTNSQINDIGEMKRSLNLHYKYEDNSNYNNNEIKNYNSQQNFNPNLLLHNFSNTQKLNYFNQSNYNNDNENYQYQNKENEENDYNFSTLNLNNNNKDNPFISIDKENYNNNYNKNYNSNGAGKNQNQKNEIEDDNSNSPTFKRSLNSNLLSEKEKTNIISEILLKIFSSEKLNLNLKKKYGNDYHSKLADRSIETNLLFEIDRDVKLFFSKNNGEIELKSLNDDYINGEINYKELRKTITNISPRKKLEINENYVKKKMGKNSFSNSHNKNSKGFSTSKYGKKIENGFNNQRGNKALYINGSNKKINNDDSSHNRSGKNSSLKEYFTKNSNFVKNFNTGD